MTNLALAAALVVAAAHVGFMVLESVLWTTPTGRRIFAQTAGATDPRAGQPGI